MTPTPVDGRQLRYGTPVAPILDEVYEVDANTYQQRLAAQRVGADIAGLGKFKRRKLTKRRKKR